MFNQIDLFTQALGLQEPWKVKDVSFDINENRLDIYISKIKGSKVKCPICGEECSAHDSKERTWRHLNFFQYKAFIHCNVPRCNCDEHGVKQVEVPWTRPGAGFTLLFEAFIMTLVRNIPVNAVAMLVGVYSDLIWRVIDHYVEEAYNSVDFIKSKVLYATEGKGSATIESFKKNFEVYNGNMASVENISCDMSQAFISGINKYFPDADITFDKFHAIKRVNEAVDT